MIKAVIIDDEEDSRKILANYLSKYCVDVEVCGFGKSVATGTRLYRNIIQILSSLILKCHMATALIFSTA